MILVDTSVWIDYLNGTVNRQSDALDGALYRGEVAIADLILLEILQGFRHERDYRSAKRFLEPLYLFEILGHGLALDAASAYRKLRQSGVTIRKTADLIIATFCIRNRLPLLYRDRSFDPFVKRLGLVDASLDR